MTLLPSVLTEGRLLPMKQFHETPFVNFIKEYESKHLIRLKWK